MTDETTEKKEVVVITPFEAQKATLLELVKDYKGLVVTNENLKEMNEKRLVLYRHRIEIQRIEKANNDALNKAKKLNSSRAEELIGVIHPHEKDLETKIKVLEQAEANRVAGIKKAIEDVKARVLKVSTFVESSALMEMEKRFLEWKLTFDPQEFKAEFEEACAALASTISDKLAVLIMKEDAVKNAVKQEEAPVAIPPQTTSSNAPVVEVSTSRVDQNIHIPNSEAQTFEQRAKEGEFSVSLSVNYTYMGHRFHLSSKLSESSLKLVKDFIKETIDKELGEEEF